MDLQELIHKVTTDMQHVQLALDANQPRLALVTAKRARRNVTSLVRQIAEQRDATTQEGTSK